MEEEADEDEFDFSNRGNDDADDDEEDVDELFGVGFFDAEEYASCENGDGRGGLSKGKRLESERKGLLPEGERVPLAFG